MRLRLQSNCQCPTAAGGTAGISVTHVALALRQSVFLVGKGASDAATRMIARDRLVWLRLGARVSEHALAQALAAYRASGPTAPGV